MLFDLFDSIPNCRMWNGDHKDFVTCVLFDDQRPDSIEKIYAMAL
jgi:hypothetical protein